MTTIRDRASAMVERVPRMGFTYDIEQLRSGLVIARRKAHNVLTIQGKRHIMDVAMHGGTGMDVYAAKTSFYVILAASNTAPADTMTYDVQVFTEFVDYNEASRQTWNGVLQADPSLTMHNSVSKAIVNIVAQNVNSGVIEGAGLVSNAVKGNHDPFGTDSDVLISYSKFGSPLSVAENDIVNVTVTLSFT